ncbi:uncharacterized protein LOC125236185 [Leguminivora glycinivorella]|uniref:uncharacterized protein LOC125236185 n=1 Tax=Leguminivora glycinivorella TaxID=1035111 RepID=UPI00200C613E|nr:uncharacterized protein LOC125236185 [Leguminivora glycinivorella]
MDSETTDLPNTSGMKIMTRKHVFDLFKSEKLPTLEEKLCSLRDQLFSSDGCTNDQIELFKSNFAYFKSEFKTRWIKAQYKEDRFIKNNHSWLEGTFAIPIAERPANRAGRPCKHFEELSERSKRRKTEVIRSNFDKEVIVHATQVELRKSGNRDASNVLKEITNSPTRATKYKKAYYRTKSSNDNIRPLTTQEAMQMFIDAELSRAQYDIIRSTNKKFFPSYNQLQKEKKKCYPPSEVCNVTSTSAEVELQPLMDLTVKRLSEHLEEVLLTLKEQERQSLKLICK